MSRQRRNILNNTLHNARAFLAELWTREVKYVESDDYWENGEADDYSETIERAILNSPTASRASVLFTKFIHGAGLTVDVDFGEDFLSDKVRDISRNLAIQGGSWIHRSVKYDADTDMFVTDKIEVMNYHYMRKGKADDDDNEGRIYLRDKHKDLQNLTKENTPWFYPFSNNQEIIRAQIEADAKDKDAETIAEKLNHYRGQVYYINTTSDFIYAISPFDSVFNDMDTEYRVSLYTNKVFRSGFLGKKIFLFKEQDPLGMGKDGEVDEFEDVNEHMKNLIQSWMGAENSDSVFVSSVSSTDDIDDFMKVINVESDFNEDMFRDSVSRLRRNILGAASGLPEALVFSNDNGLFSGSGEQVVELKKFYNEQTEAYRFIINKSLKKLGFDTEIIELV